ncbi:MAG: hypothetical protein U0R69_03940 [Gaiellales bacterium]
MTFDRKPVPGIGRDERTASKAPLASFGVTEAGFLVGAGIMPAGATQVEIVLKDGSRVAPKLIPGGFVVDESLEIKPEDVITIQSQQK